MALNGKAELPTTMEPDDYDCSECSSVLEQLVTHVPDIIVQHSNDQSVPQTINSYGVVMFADISGFTALCEKYCSTSTSKKKGTDQLTSTLNAYLSQLVQAILEDGGDVLKFAGDALLAYWECSRFEASGMLQFVLRESLTMQTDFDNYQTPDGFILRVKIGLSIGPTEIHYIGSEDYKTFDITGKAVDDVNIAQSYTKPGAVVISKDAWEMCNQERCFARLVGPGYAQICKISFEINDGTPTLTTLLTRGGRRPTLSAVTRNAVSSRRSSTTSEDNSQKTRRSSVVSYTKSHGLLLRKKVRNGLQAFNEHSQCYLRCFVLKTVVQKIDHGYDVSWLSELRQVSVMFINLDPDLSDLPGSSTCSREQKLLQNAFEAVYPSLIKFDGSLNKVFMFDKGCTFLCIFGLPHASHEDDPNRALRAAKSIFSRLTEMKLNHHSIGITTGIAFCGVVGHSQRHEYTVIGQKVNMAARLMMKFPDAVTCDESTRAKSSIPPQNFTITPPVHLKGISNPKDIYFVSTEINNQIPVSNSDIHEPTDADDLIGREKEMNIFLAELQHMMEQVHSGPGVIILSGPGGIGKTKLLRAMKAKAAEMGFRVVSGIGGLIEQNTPFFTVKTLLTRLLELDTCANVHEKEQLILQLITDEDMRKVLPVLNDLLVLKFPQTSHTLHLCHDERTKALHQLLFHIVHEEALTHPCIFGVDDAQWIDHDSWTFLIDLALDPHATVLLATRPLEDIHFSLAIKELWNHPNTTILELEGLSCEEMVALACQMLNVDELPGQIIEIIRTRSHGIPLWCEELVETMLEMKVLEVVEQDEVIVQEPGEIDEEEKTKRLQDVANSSCSLSHCGTGRRAVIKTMKRRKSCVGREIGIGDIPIPDSVAGMVLTRIDNMNPSEQMTIKCAAVIGTTFHRDMLQAIIPNCNPAVFSQTLNILAEHGIIECSVAAEVRSRTPDLHSRSTHHSQIHLPEDPYLQCPCLNSLRQHHRNHLLHTQVTSHPPVDECAALQFVHTYVQETVYGLWTESQCQCLHESAAQYLETQAHKCVNCGGGGFIMGSNQARSGRKKSATAHGGRAFIGTSNIRHKIRRSSAISAGENRRSSQLSSIGSDNMGSSLSDLRQAWISNRRGSNDYDIQTTSRPQTAISQIHFDTDIVDIDMQDCHCDEVLAHVYPQIIRHWKAAGDTHKTLIYLIEAAVTALATFNNMEAISLLQETREMLQENEEDNMLEKLELAKLESLFGQAYFQCGEIDECMVYFKSALQVLDTHLPSSNIGSLWNLLYQSTKQFLHFKFPRRYLGRKRGKDSEKFLNQSRCMAHITHAYHLQHENMKTLMAALQQLNAAEEAQEDIHELVESYATMVECCQLFNFKRFGDIYLEKALILCSAVQFGVEDISTYAHLLNVTLNVKLCQGKVIEALEVGSAVTRITSKVHDVPMKLVALPLLFQAYLQTLRVQQCKETLKQLGEVSDESDDLRAQALLDCCQFDALLDIGINADEGSKLAQAAEICCKEDVYHFDDVERFFLVSCLALWHCRKDNFTTGSKFLYIAKTLLPLKYETFLAVRALVRFVECILLVYRETQVDRNLRNEAKQVRHSKCRWKGSSISLKILNSNIKKFAFFKTRYLHMKAYYKYIGGKRSEAKSIIKQALKTDRVSFELDCMWIKNSSYLWFEDHQLKEKANNLDITLFPLQ